MLRSHPLYAASRPFVTRALRGGHRLRYSALALLLALVSLVLGTWLALGPGRFEHDLRVGLGLEPTLEVQERQGFKLFAADEHEAVRLHQLIQQRRSAIGLASIALDGVFSEPSFELEYRVDTCLQDGLYALASAVHPDRARSIALRDLREPARALLSRFQLEDAEDLRAWSSSIHARNDATAHATVHTILARELRPAVEVYRSPLAPVDAFKLAGLISGAMILLLCMVHAPVLAGAQMAQEVHENTLQPLTGTALSARELVVGLSLGPAAVVALLAAPQVALFLAAAIALGHLLPALALLLVALVGGAFLTMLAQLAGLALGRTRSPGMLGVGLLALFAPLAVLGLLFGLELPLRATGVLALLPQAAGGYSLFATFSIGDASPRSWLEPAEAVAAGTSVLIGALGMLCFAYLGLRALERRVGELAPAALRRGEALLGAGVSIALVTLANPWHLHPYNPSDFYLTNLALVLVPLTILLMMRVPLGDTPPALRRPPIAGLLGEFALGVGLFLAVTAACIGLEPLRLLRSPVALAYLAWMIAVLGMLAIRVVALPMTLLAKLWAGVGVLGVGVALGHVVAWSRNDAGMMRQIFALSEISPLLGVLQVLLMVSIPLSLVRALQNRGSTTAALE